jgi:outer membrane protein W
MKKLLVLFMFAMGFNIYCTEPGEMYFEPKIGAGLSFGIESNDSDAKFDVEGISFYGLEGYYKFTDRIDFGWGLLYMESTTTKTNADNTKKEEKIKKTPIYLALKAHLFPNWALNPYLKFMYGYEFVEDSNIDEIQDGKYMGAAIGLDIMALTVETFVTAEEIYESDEDYDVAIGLGFAFGYKF